MAEKARPIEQLFQEISLDKKEAFNQLFHSFYGRLIIFARQYVKQGEYAEDIISELFIRLWQRRNHLAAISNPEVYLYTAVKNACLNHLRQNKRQLQVFSDETTADDLNISSSSDPVKELEYKELRAKLDNAVETLPEQRRLIFKMVKEDGLKCREVAEILGLSVRTVESQIYKAVKALADTLEPYLGKFSSKDISSSKVSLFSLLFFF